MLGSWASWSTLLFCSQIAFEFQICALTSCVQVDVSQNNAVVLLSILLMLKLVFLTAAGYHDSNLWAVSALYLCSLRSLCICVLRATDAPEHVPRWLQRPLLLQTDGSLSSLCRWQSLLWRGSKLLGASFPAVVLQDPSVNKLHWLFSAYSSSYAEVFYSQRSSVFLILLICWPQTDQFKLRKIKITCCPLLSASSRVFPVISSLSVQWKGSVEVCCFKVLWLMLWQWVGLCFHPLQRPVPDILHTVAGEAIHVLFLQPEGLKRKHLQHQL